MTIPFSGSPGDDAYKDYPPLILTPPEIAYLVKGTDRGLADYPRLNSRFAPENEAKAVAIILAESGGNVYALNKKPPDLSYGLAQINMIGALGVSRRFLWGIKKNSELYQADLNVAIMASLSVSGNNFRPWSTYTNLKFQQYMDEASAAVAHPVNPGSKLRTPQQAKEDAEGNVFDDFTEWINKGVVRGAGFVGGAALIGTAVALAVKKGVK